MSRELESSNQSCAANFTGVQCGDDCRTRLVCTGQETPSLSQDCGSLNVRRPYCVENTCTATPNVSNSACNSAFTCTSEGVFPDPNDCKSYWYCPDTGEEAVGYTCSDGYVFYSKASLCRRREKPNFCQTFNCGTQLNRVIVFKANPVYYAFCGGPDQTYYFKCAAEKTKYLI